MKVRHRPRAGCAWSSSSTAQGAQSAQPRGTGSSTSTSPTCTLRAPSPASPYGAIRRPLLR
eukprot:6978482-Prymnesium_polylepis.1